MRVSLISGPVPESIGVSLRLEQAFVIECAQAAIFGAVHTRGTRR